MGIFDDVVVNAKSAAQTVGKMAGQFVDMSKLRINMSELNGEITKRAIRSLAASFTRPRRPVPQTKPSLQTRSPVSMICMHSFPQFPHSTLPCRIK